MAAVAAASSGACRLDHRSAEAHVNEEPVDVPLMPELLASPVADLIQRWEARALRTSWRGVQMIKSPADAWVLQELVVRLRPEVVVEVGCFRGGTSLFIADLMELSAHGRVITIDHRPGLIDRRVTRHPRISVIEGFALDVVEQVRATISAAAPVLVVEDSNHSSEHTLAICRAYADMVSPGSYLVVEDTHFERGLADGDLPGPAIAVREFLAEDDRFVADRGRESFGITFNPGGYLLRTK
jgi:cephalosporin hydroxylase